MSNRTYHRWTAKEEQFLKDNFQNYTCNELAEMLKVSVAAVKRKRTDLKISKSKEALKKIYGRPNPGQFKKGELPLNTLYDKAITTRIDKNGNAYKWIRVSMKVWQPLHKYLWLQAGNTIPEGHIVVFKDKNTLNCVLQNLQLITRSEHLKRNQQQFIDKYGTRRLPKSKNQIAQKTRKVILKQKIKSLKVSVSKEKKVIQQRINAQQRELQRIKKEQLQNQKKFQTNQIDYSQLQTVRIDRKTVIYIKPGQDPEQIKAKYLKQSNK